MGDWIIESKNNYTNASTSDSAVNGFITLEARDGDSRIRFSTQNDTRKLNGWNCC